PVAHGETEAAQGVLLPAGRPELQRDSQAAVRVYRDRFACLEDGPVCLPDLGPDRPARARFAVDDALDALETVPAVRLGRPAEVGPGAREPRRDRPGPITGGTDIEVDRAEQEVAVAGRAPRAATRRARVGQRRQAQSAELPHRRASDDDVGILVGVL